MRRRGNLDRQSPGRRKRHPRSRCRGPTSRRRRNRWATLNMRRHRSPYPGRGTRRRLMSRRPPARPHSPPRPRANRSHRSARLAHARCIRTMKLLSIRTCGQRLIAPPTRRTRLLPCRRCHIRQRGQRPIHPWRPTRRTTRGTIQHSQGASIRSNRRQWPMSNVGVRPLARRRCFTSARPAASARPQTRCIVRTATMLSPASACGAASASCPSRIIARGVRPQILRLCAGHPTRDARFKTFTELARAG